MEQSIQNRNKRNRESSICDQIFSRGYFKNWRELARVDVSKKPLERTERPENTRLGTGDVSSQSIKRVGVAIEDESFPP